MFSCVLNHQLPFQTYLATYFVGTDLILIYQYFYFGNNTQTCTEEALKINGDDTQDHLHDEESLLLCSEPLELIKTVEDISPLNATYGSTDNKKPAQFLMGFLLLGFKLGLGSSFSTHTTTGVEDINSMLVNTGSSSVVTPGWILAWMCTTFYLVSRIPQIYKNYRRHSTQGLSLALFSFAVSGNVTYALSIMLHPGHTRRSLMESLPYVTGSIGTLFLDAIIFGQFMYYKKKNNVRNITTVLSRVPTTQ